MFWLESSILVKSQQSRRWRKSLGFPMGLWRPEEASERRSLSVFSRPCLSSAVLIVWFLLIIWLSHSSPDSDLITVFLSSQQSASKHLFNSWRSYPPSPANKHIYRQSNNSVSISHRHSPPHTHTHRVIDQLDVIRSMIGCLQKSGRHLLR